MPHSLNFASSAGRKARRNVRYCGLSAAVHLKVRRARALGDFDERFQRGEIKAIRAVLLRHADELHVGAVMPDRGIERGRETGYENGVDPVRNGGADEILHQREIAAAVHGNAVIICNAVAVQPIGHDEVALPALCPCDGERERRLGERFARALRRKRQPVPARAEFAAVDFDEHGARDLRAQEKVRNAERAQEIGVQPRLSDRIVVRPGKRYRNRGDIILGIQPHRVGTGASDGDFLPHLVRKQKKLQRVFFIEKRAAVFQAARSFCLGENFN